MQFTDFSLQARLANQQRIFKAFQSVNRHKSEKLFILTKPTVSAW